MKKTYLEEFLDESVVDVLELILHVLEAVHVSRHRHLAANPGVLPDFLQGHPLDRERLQHPVDEVLQLGAQKVRHHILALFYLLEELRYRIIVEGQHSHHHCIEDDPT